MPYDLYGNSYPTRREAEIAEMAQVAEIDARHTRMEIQQAQRQQENSHHDIWQYIEMLEGRIRDLEEKITAKAL